MSERLTTSSSFLLGPFQSMREIKKANEELGHYFFDDGAMRFFDSIIYPTVYKGRFFVTSEKGPNGIRAYTLRCARDDGSVWTVGEHQQHATIKEARKAAKAANIDDIPQH